MSNKKHTNALSNPKFLSLAVIALAILLFVLARILISPAAEPVDNADEYAEYELAKVVNVLADNCESDPIADGGFRGEQLILAIVRSGQYKGQTLQAYNYVGPVYGVPVKTGDNVVLIISTYANGDHMATVYEYSRLVPLLIVLAAFFAVTLALGGKTGFKSIISLLFTLACLFFILIPALMKGAPMIPVTFLVCAYIAIVSLTVMGGICTKTMCAAAGAVSGTGLALFFGAFSQSLARINGLREQDAEALLQLRQTGEASVGLKGLLIAGIIISSLGAVMDVTMGITSSMQEIHLVNPEISEKELISSGLNIGKDMVGTMSNTLILAFLGSDLTLILYLSSLGLSFHQLISSSYLSLEMISGLSSSVGVILSIPVTVIITAKALKRD